MDTFTRACVLGGAGLVGIQVCRRLLMEGLTNHVTVVSLGPEEVSAAVGQLREEFPGATIDGRCGNVFARGVLSDPEAPAETDAADVGTDAHRRALLSDLYLDFDRAVEDSALARLILADRPDAVIDCINTATGISYQDIPTTARRLITRLEHEGGDATLDRAIREDVEGLMASIEIPQLILHVRILHRALVEVGSKVYLKVGTTGTGGMGLNLPFTHGEEKPSPTLMAKTAVAFAQTGLLFLAARAEGGPVVKELKPAAMIGYREVSVQDVPGKGWVREDGKLVLRRLARRPLYEARPAQLDEPLETTPDPEGWSVRTDESGAARSIRLACVNTGENGWFAHDEFETITALDMMEIITPEEIARVAVQELRGRSTGRDVISAIDASILGPTYKGGLLRQVALDRIKALEAETAGSSGDQVPSVALGDLGPPQLSKYLFELHIVRAAFGSLEDSAAGLRRDDAAGTLAELVRARPDLRDAIVSVGLPILMPDGVTLLRGPEIKIPGWDPTRPAATADREEIELWASRGWVDLRTEHLLRWADRLDRIIASRRGGSAGGSDAMTSEVYGRDDFRLGEVVAWVFANEPEFGGYRIK